MDQWKQKWRLLKEVLSETNDKVSIPQDFFAFCIVCPFTKKTFFFTFQLLTTIFFSHFYKFFFHPFRKIQKKSTPRRKTSTSSACALGAFSTWRASVRQLPRLPPLSPPPYFFFPTLLPSSASAILEKGKGRCSSARAPHLA